MNFVALDFEKANRYSHSICSIGLVLFENSQIVEEKQILIQPPNNSYGDIEMSIHGITPEHTQNAPAFSEVWESIQNYFADYPLVAHNALSVEGDA